MKRMDNRKLSGLIGLCMRARQLVLGTDMVLKAVRGGKAAVILMDEGASENLRKKLRDASSFHRVPLLELEAGLLDRAAGQDGKMAAAVLYGTLAEQIRQAMNPVPDRSDHESELH